jgi:tyramine---L-glutamate ligase
VRILLYEYFSSCRPGSVPVPLRRAGRALRETARLLLGAVPGVEVLGRPTSSGAEARFRRQLRNADAALVIAPETAGRLARLSHAVDRSRATPLGCGPRAARLAGDKRATARLLARAGVATPRTRRVARGSAGRRALARVPPPFVLKPADGCGAEGVEIVREARAVDAALARTRRAAGGRAVIVQPYVTGTPLSVTLLVRSGAAGARSGDDARGGEGHDPPGSGAAGAIAALAVGRQILAGRRSLRYVGGEIPVGGAAAAAGVRLAVRAVAALAARTPDLRGPVGVDLVLGREGPVVIEINPRLTSSWIGLRRIAGAGLGPLILDAARGLPLPRVISTRGRCRFSAGGRVTSLPRGARATRRTAVHRAPSRRAPRRRAR